MPSPAEADKPFSAEEHARLLHPADRRGTVTLARRDSRWIERPVRVEGLEPAVQALPHSVDVYLSQQRFRGWRRVSQLLELGACYADLDYQTTQLRHESPERVAYRVLCALRAAHIPEPWIFSTGRGLLALWPHTPVPRRALPRWNAVQRHLGRALHGFGIDRRALDAARVFRLAGTRNSKAGYIDVRLLHTPDTARWSFDDLAHEVLPLGRQDLKDLQRDRAQRAAEKDIHAGGRVANDLAPRLSVATLWAKRLDDLQALRWYRWADGIDQGWRDTWLFLAGVAVSWLKPAHTLPNECRPLAEEAGLAGEENDRLSAVFSRARAAADGDEEYRYRFRTSTIVEWLDIAPSEMRAAGLRTLVTPEVRREIEAADTRAARRAQGVRDRRSYEAESLSRRRPWEALGVSRATWYRWGKPDPDGQ